MCNLLWHYKAKCFCKIGMADPPLSSDPVLIYMCWYPIFVIIIILVVVKFHKAVVKNAHNFAGKKQRTDLTYAIKSVCILKFLFFLLCVTLHTTYNNARTKKIPTPSKIPSNKVKTIMFYLEKCLTCIILTKETHIETVIHCDHNTKMCACCHRFMVALKAAQI